MLKTFFNTERKEKKIHLNSHRKTHNKMHKDNSDTIRQSL